MSTPAYFKLFKNINTYSENVSMSYLNKLTILDKCEMFSAEDLEALCVDRDGQSLGKVCVLMHYHIVLGIEAFSPGLVSILHAMKKWSHRSQVI